MTLEIKVLGEGDDAVLANVDPEVFDHPVDSGLAAEFLNDPRHHLAVALVEGCVVGMASAVHYVHPDKQPELWINEVGVAPGYQRQGIAKKLLDALMEVGRRKNCGEAWVLTERSNPVAMKLYAAVGGVIAPEDPVMFTIKLKANPER
tara:strand:- start:215 stop:658 length:444 start_codon:yes stop_codon:yes gene_type:complete